MPFKDWLYYFIEEDGRSLFRDHNVVSSSGSHIPQVFSPGGWQEVSILWERDLQKYYGLNRNFSLALEFYGDSAFILRDQHVRTNIERKIYLLIQYLTLQYGPTNYKFLYKFFYKGELDFSTFKSAQDKVTMNIVEGSLAKLLKANETKTYTIPFDDTAIDIFLDGILLDGVYRFILLERTSGTTGTAVPMILDSDEQKAPGIAVFSVTGASVVTWLSINGDSLDFFFEDAIPPEGGTIHFEGTIRMSVPVITNPAGIILHRYNTRTHTLKPFIYLYVGNEAAEILIDIDIPVEAGDRFFLEIDEYTFESELTLSVKTRNPPTTIKAYKPRDAYGKLIQKVTGVASNGESALLTSNKNLALTCGDAIRGFSNATIKTSFSDFFADYAISCFAGLSIQGNKIRMEDRATYFDETNPIKLGTIKGHTWSEAADLLGNTLRVGSLKPDIEDVNGRFDPNGGALLTLPITKVVKDIDLVGPYKKGPYEIEMIRINLEGKTTTDDSSDNDCFVIDVIESTPTTQIVTFLGNKITVPASLAVQIGMRIKVEGSALNSGYYTVTSIFNLITTLQLTTDGAFTTEASVSVVITLPHLLDRSPVVTADPEVCPSPSTIFNVRLTPKNLFYKQKRQIRSMLHGFDGEKVKWESSDKNSKFQAIVDGVLMDEDRDENVSDLGEKLFIPIWHDFETIVPVEYEGKTLVELLDENPNRCFEWITEDGITLRGFNAKCGLAPNTQAPQQFKMLGAPSNDYTQLIY